MSGLPSRTARATEGTPRGVPAFASGTRHTAEKQDYGYKRTIAAAAWRLLGAEVRAHGAGFPIRDARTSSKSLVQSAGPKSSTC